MLKVEFFKSIKILLEKQRWYIALTILYLDAICEDSMNKYLVGMDAKLQIFMYVYSSS